MDQRHRRNSKIAVVAGLAGLGLVIAILALGTNPGRKPQGIPAPGDTTDRRPGSTAPTTTPSAIPRPVASRTLSTERH